MGPYSEMVYIGVFRALPDLMASAARQPTGRWALGVRGGKEGLGMHRD